MNATSTSAKTDFIRQRVLDRAERHRLQGRHDKAAILEAAAKGAALRVNELRRAAALLVAAAPCLPPETYEQFLERTGQASGCHPLKLKLVVREAVGEYAEIVNRPLPSEIAEPVEPSMIEDIRTNLLVFAKRWGGPRRVSIEALLNGRAPGEWHGLIRALARVTPDRASSEAVFDAVVEPVRAKVGTPSRTELLQEFKKARWSVNRARELAVNPY